MLKVFEKNISTTIFYSKVFLYLKYNNGVFVTTPSVSISLFFNAAVCFADQSILKSMCRGSRAVYVYTGLAS